MDFFLLLLLFLSVNGFSGTLARDHLTPNQQLADGDKLVSAGGTFAIGFFSPSTSSTIGRRYLGIWFNNIAERTVVWVANRQNPVTNSTGVLSVSMNGTLIISSKNSTVVWSSSSSSTMQSPVAQLLDTGNFVVRESSNSGEIAWQSFEYPTNTLLAGMKLGWNLTSGLNRNLTSWSSEDDPSPGPFTMALDLNGIPQLFLYRGGEKVWRVGPWNGLRLVGQPFMNNATNRFNFSFFDNRRGGEVYYTYANLEYKMARLVLTSEGLYQRLVWFVNKWVPFWSNPGGTCDTLSVCGPFGICDANAIPTCKCVQGFEPRDPTAWDNGNGREGCVRKTPLSCKNGTGADGFYVVEEAKLPDTTEVTVDRSIGLDECKARCLVNCSCTGFASANISGGGSGCIMWSTKLTDVRLFPNSGQDLYVRLAAADLPRNKTGNTKKKKIAITLSVLVTFVLISCLSFLWWVRRRAKRKRMQAELLLTLNSDFVKKLGEYEEGRPEFMIFGFSDIAGATNNFSADNKLGEGGFGPVYKGELRDGKEIAVKRLSTRSGQGLEEFKNEILLIAKLQHRNLVRLLGCCIQEEEKILIYEYMPHKSLDFYLFGPCMGRQLDWKMRSYIMEGIAQGLLYLHKHSRLRIIHRDLKASNILLDKDMNPKISDFGMARIFSSEEIQANTHRVVGTYGYMAPEYASHGIFSIKSDVFSYGVLMLEILSGMRNTGFHKHGNSLTLQAYAWELWKEGNPLKLMDTFVADDVVKCCSASDVVKCIHIGLLCVQENADDRPTMSDVIGMLGGDGASFANPNQPAFFIPRPTAEVDFDSENPQICSKNGLTVTTVNGR